MAFRVPNRFRIKSGQLGSTDDYGNNGAFSVRFKNGCSFNVIAADGDGWEHVSVSIPGIRRCPTWEEMCQVKVLFWDEDDMVIQYHPPKSSYVNNHPYVLHLWRKCGSNEFAESPPTYMV